MTAGEPSVGSGPTTGCAGADEHWPVIVIGGGPAGATAAATIARSGLPVLLIERASADQSRMSAGGKVCGGCLNGVALREIRRLDSDVAEAVRRRGVRLDRVRIFGEGRRYGSLLPMGESVAIGRDDLDPWLRAAAERAGATVRMGVSASIAEIPSPGTCPLVRMTPTAGGDVEHGIAATAALVLVADGLAGSSLRTSHPALRARRRDLRGQRIGIGTIADAAGGGAVPSAGELMMIAGSGGYLGAVGLGGGRLDLAAAVDPAAIADAGGPEAWIVRTAACVLGDAGEPSIGGPWRVRGTPPLATRATCPVLGGVLRIGDGLAFAEPFTGQGIGWAMSNGRDAGEMVVAALRSEGAAARPRSVPRCRTLHAHVERAWRKQARRHVRSQASCRRIAGVLRTRAGRAAFASGLRIAPAPAAAWMRLIGRSASGSSSVSAVTVATGRRPGRRPGRRDTEAAAP